MRYSTAIPAAVAALLLVLAQVAAANPYDPTAVKPRNPAPSLVVPLTTEVPGKEFSDNRDRDALGAADAEQVVLWDGAGGTADGFDYTGSRDPEVPGEVDGLSNNADILFNNVVGNTTSLLFSVQNDGNIYFERQDGVSGTWATAATIDGMNAPNDIDGLEIWGPELASDADRYSLQGDPGLPGGPGVAIWGYNSGAHTSTPILLSTTLAGLIGLETVLLDQLDLDAMMVNPGSEAERIIFSIAPVVDATGALLFDGGEIWTWDGVAASASFLNHGGHIWNTAFDVMGTFGLNSENINAIEGASVPEPGISALLGAGLALLALLGRRSR